MICQNTSFLFLVEIPSNWPNKTYVLLLLPVFITFLLMSLLSLIIYGSNNHILQLNKLPTTIIFLLNPSSVYHKWLGEFVTIHNSTVTAKALQYVCSEREVYTYCITYRSEFWNLLLSKGQNKYIMSYIIYSVFICKSNLQSPCHQNNFKP